MAIVFDAAASGSGHSTSINISHTCTGSDRILFVGTANGNGATISGVTYNSVAMTLVAASGHNAGTSQIATLWYLVAPATGSNTITITATGTTDIFGAAASYTGASQTGQPDSSNTNFDVGAGVSTLSQSTTVVASNCWAVMVGFNDNGGSLTAGTGSTRRADGGSGNAIFDSNTTVSTGAYSMAYSGGNGHYAMSMASFTPVGGGATVLPFKALLGVGI